LVIELEEPVNYFLYLMANQVSYAVPSHVVEEEGTQWIEKDPLVCNGPFQLESREIGQSIVLTRNPTYQGNFPGNVERVEMTTSQIDPSDELKMYMSGDIDTFATLLILPRAERERVRHQHSDEYVTFPAFMTGCWNINCELPPFDNRDVRRAFTMALDRELYIQEVFGADTISPAMGGFIPPGMTGHSPGIGLSFNLEKAQALLREAGFPNGDGFPPIVVYHMSSPLQTSMFENIRHQWTKNLGVEISNKTYELTEYFIRVSREAPQIHIGGWTADYPDPDNFLRTYSTHRSVNWTNEAFDELVEQARRLPDQEERIRLYQKADRLLIEDAAIVPLTYGRNDFLIKPWVKNLTFPPIGMPAMKYLIIEPH
jgi:oligopeptide transport system substrate-binding protein